MNTAEKIEALQKQIDELKASLVNGEWPKMGDEYWFLDCGDIRRSWWDNDDLDRKRKQRGNIYRTEEEAKRADDRRILIAEIREFAGHYKPVWDCTFEYTISFNVRNKKCGADGLLLNFMPICGYFKDEATARAAIETFKDRLHLLREV